VHDPGPKPRIPNPRSEVRGLWHHERTMN
jgi:hypothetical protein